MTADPESRALALVRRARRAAFLHAAVRALARGVTAGALFAVALASAARIAGVEPGPWLAVAFAPALVVAVPGLLSSRPRLVRAALLLDGAAGSKERFTAVLTSPDPEVRDLAARQALAEPALAGGSFPVAFPPSVEGLAAVLAVAVLAAVLLLLPAPPPGTGTRRTASAAPPGAAAAPGAAKQGDPERAPAPDAVPRGESRALAAVAAGRNLSEADWEKLRPKGVTEGEQKSIEAALARGDPAAAARALRAALAAATAPDGGATAPDGPKDGGGWSTFAAALKAPTWSPEHDEIVRRYFELAGRRGLR